ncbi:MAG TPA: glutamate--tRNA ligase [Acidiferrobacteraceae bacterium]|nr:glutamate--tRNA ligase [Acidiferrobacteraceae bacterium]
MSYDGAFFKQGLFMTVRTRFAPSPTGYLHVGGARTALYSWLYARRHGGSFILRIEDTDLERSTAESVDAILASMRWLDLDWDEGPYFQTQRFDRYRAVIAQLVAAGKAYACYCSKEELEEMRTGQLARKEKPRYDRRCLHRTAPAPEGVRPVIRFKNPTEGSVIVDDQIKGRVVFQNSELDDLIIARSDGTPTYNFTVVVDDWDMAITHVIRGDDHLNNTPRQINMLLALGATPPVYAHVPMILGPDGSRLSKRHGAVSVLQYRDEGYLPEALLNYLVRLGWSHGDQEIFTREEMIRLFDIQGVNGAAAAFNPEKLLWLNQQYLKTTAPARLGALLEPFLEQMGSRSPGPSPADVAAAQRERARTLVEMAANSTFFYQAEVPIDPAAKAKHWGPAAVAGLCLLQQRLTLVEPWAEGAIHEAIEEAAQAAGLTFGKLSQALRVAVAGKPVSPPIDVTVSLLGRERTLQRLAQAVAAAPA